MPSSGILLTLLLGPGVLAGSPPARDCPGCPEMVRIPAGSYWMGSAKEALNRPFLEADRVEIEQPRQRITLTRDFDIGRTEITVAQYRAFAKATARAASPCRTFNFGAKRWEDVGRTWENPGFTQTDDHPAVCVNWDDARAYTQWLSKTTGQSYRLPSESEWEYAARAGTDTLWPWGDQKDAACIYANASDRAGVSAQVSSQQSGIFECDDGYAGTAPVGFGEPNGFGLQGMIGNAGEWQQDCLVRTLEGIPANGAPRETPGCADRVMRGGSWFNPPLYSRSAFRYGTGHGEAYNLVGIRVVREVKGETGSAPKAALARSSTDPKSRMKRIAVQVPDLDRAIIFFRDVLGFTLTQTGTIEAGAEPYMHYLFNTDPGKAVRRALFNTATEQRGLFIAENSDMTPLKPGEPRSFAAVFEVSDIEGVRQRARRSGFDTIDPEMGKAPDGTPFAEMIITGPGGLAVAVFHYGAKAGS